MATVMNRRRRLFEISVFWNLGIPFFWNYEKRGLATFSNENRLKAVFSWQQLSLVALRSEVVEPNVSRGQR